MQFIGDMHQTTTSGSENWYIPTTTGQWNANTKQCVMSSDGSGSRKGTVLVYGPAYGNSANGYVMYEGGHDLDGSGTTAQKVAAQRAYFNFLLTAGISKALQITSTVPATAYAKEKVDITGTAASGTGPYNFSWSSQLGAVFSSANQQTTKYHAPDVSTNTNDIITLTITDNCSRVNFISKPITIKTTLPIKLKSFDAYPSDNVIKVYWTTAAEINNDNFTIERSKDGINYATIGKVRGAGNSTVLLDYSFVDEQPFEGTSYYRLKQTDYDGKFEIFKAVSVNLKEKLNDINSLRTFPNPFSETFTAEFESIEEMDVQVQILGLNSLMISNENIHLHSGKNTYRFTAPADLKTGVYIFRILNGSVVLAVTKIYCRKN